MPVPFLEEKGFKKRQSGHGRILCEGHFQPKKGLKTMAQSSEKKEVYGPLAKREENKTQSDFFFAPFFALQKEINGLFERSMDNFSNLPNAWHYGAEKMMPQVDVKEDDKEFNIQTRLPTERPEDVEISITDNYLTIKCHAEQKNQEKSKSGSRMPYSSKSGQRTIMLPETANADKAEAEVKGNVLVVTVPKREDVAQKARKIDGKKEK